MSTEKTPLPQNSRIPAIAARLRATRAAMGLRAVDICRAVGITQSAYSQYEAGKYRPNLDDMIRYAEVYRVPLDWIYRGDPSNLPLRLANKLPPHLLGTLAVS